MIEINLVPDVKQELIKAQSIRSKVIFFSIMTGVLSIAVVAVLSIYIFGIQAVRSTIADGQIKSGSDKLASVEDLSKTLTIQNQLSKISDLNSQKKMDSRIFDVLNAVIPASPNDVQISDLKIDSESNTITLDGQAASGYSAVEIFKKMIAAADINYIDSDNNNKTVAMASDISTSDTSYGEDSSGNKVLRFTISFVYDDALFSPDSSSLTIKISSTGNVTDSYLGVPASIFAERASDIEE